MLKLQFRDRRRESVWLVDQTFTIGKAASNSLMIDDESVLDFHAEIINKNDKLSIKNLAAKNLTDTQTATKEVLFINGQAITEQSPLKAKDIITLGTIELELIDPKSLVEQQQSAATTNYSNSWSIYSNASWLDQNRFKIDKKTVIGRDPECDITLPLDHLSRKHVALEVRSGLLFLQDLGSSNGTFLNGQKVTSSQLKTGDKIKLDVLTFEVSGPSHDPNKTIIRTAPAQTASKPDPAKAKSSIDRPLKSAPEKNNQKKSAQNTGKSKIPKKRLVADGKQDWISGDSQKNNQPKPQKNNGMLVVGIVITLAIIATAIFTLTK